MSSMRAVRSTTLPGVMATSLPTSKPSMGAMGAPEMRCFTSAARCRTPRTRLRPRSFTVRSITSGLVMKLAGELASLTLAKPNDTMSSWCFETPGTSVLASRSHRSVTRYDWLITLKGQRCHEGAAKRRSLVTGAAASRPSVVAAAYWATLTVLVTALLARASCFVGASARCAPQSA